MNNNSNSNWFIETNTTEGIASAIEITAKLHSETTEFQQISIYDTTQFGKMMVIDDYIMLTTKDNFIYHEMLSHPIMFTHPNPEYIAIIGGGDCGTLQQVLKHQSVRSAIQIEIDPRVTALAEIYFPQLCTANQDPRAQLLFADGINWMQQASTKELDIIIIDSTDPIGPAKGLFNYEFYSNCLQALNDNGLFVQQSESPLLHLNTILKPMHSELLRAGFVQVKTLLFPQPCYPSGWWSCTMAAKSNNIDLNIITTKRQQDIINKNFVTQYYNLAVHQGALANPEFMGL